VRGEPPRTPESVEARRRAGALALKPDDLRARLARGEADALDDPALLLEWIADPGAWLEEGLVACAERICVELGAGLHGKGVETRVRLRTTLRAWQQASWQQEIYPDSACDIEAAATRVTRPHSAVKLRALLGQAVRAPAALGLAERRRLLIDLAHQLHAIEPRQGKARVAALAKIERLVG